jgi:predicted TPR repeat methyltransferase
MNNSSLHQASLNSNNDKIEIYNQWADTYEEYVESINYVGARNLALNFKDFISTGEINHLKILDFGCGTGLLGKEIQQNLSGQYIFDIDGIDISENMLQKSREKNIYRQLIDINLEHDSLSENYQYDYIVSSGVFLEGHVSFQIINKLLNNLKLFGNLLITVRESFIDKNMHDFQEYVFQNPRLELLFNIKMDYLPDVDCKLIILKKLY